ncbi:uncharacterized protein C20orf202 homolog isoform X2 [Marmota marmota marmota]|uniref:uncharacterized protein C20orf202 homolog isoform X2 n=1 Tax=Marmota marmota marmota TaxID=9994 RepID=UPI0020935003|nr:uncharacterized protein C20orf202 homolog isoform X2 [Marmota marmota marmota]
MKAAGEPTPDLGQTLEWLRRELVSRPSSQVPHWAGQRLQASLWGPATRCLIAVSGQGGLPAQDFSSGLTQKLYLGRERKGRKSLSPGNISCVSFPVEGVAGASRGDCSFSHPQALGLPGSPRSEMQIQDQQLLLTLRHLHGVLEELRAESARWEEARSSAGTSPARARAGSEGRGCQPVSLRGLAQLLRGEESRRSSLP